MTICWAAGGACRGRRLAHRTIDVSPARRPGPPTAIESHRALRRAVARIDASFHERVALDRLARHAPVTCPRSYPQQVGMAFSEDLTRVRLRRETRAWRSRRRPSPSSHPPATGDPGPGRDRPPHRADRRRQRRPGRQGPQHGLPAAPSGARPGLPSSADGRRRRHGPVFHQQRYASRHDETVMRAPRTWAARATTDETAPCAMTRGSDPVETHRRSRWYYGLSSAVDTGGRLLCNRFGHAPPE